MTRSGDPPATFSQETETPFESNPTPGEQNQAATDVVDAETSSPEDLAPTRTADIAGSSPTAYTATSVRPTEPPATSTPTPSLVRSIKLVPFSGAFARPTELVHANDERVFVVEQAGKIWIIEENERNSEPFLDITNQVSSSEFEQGLLSLVFHPSYPENYSFFVYYTDLQGNVVISRFEVDPQQPNKARADSEERLLTIQQPFVNHNGGQLRIGPDKMLYISVGDGGSAGDPFNHGQNSSTLLGTLMRIDVNVENGYVIPLDNPYIEDPSVPDEIWAVGLRNPWRFSFDRETDALYLSDVGQSTWEEINYQEAGSGGGANYGWNIVEGNHCFATDTCDTSGFDMPVAEYSHAEGGCSVTGGYVYRGQLYPEMWGNYFFGDYCSGFIWNLVQEPNGEWKKNLLLQGGFNLSSFGEDVHGEIYVLDHTSGTIYHIQPESTVIE